MAKSTARGGRLRVHVVNNADAAAVYHVTEASFRAAAKAHPGLLAKLALSFGTEPGREDAALAEAEVILSGGFDLRDLATRAPRLKWLQSTSAGVEKVIAHIPPGVVLTNASGLHAPKGGEYAMTALLMLNHRVPHFVTSKAGARWDQAFATPIAGKTVLLVGIGAIGGAAARLAKRFGMRVVGVGRSPRTSPLFGRIHGRKALPRLLPKADFLLVTTPLTPETRGLIGKAELDLLPRHAGVVNLGRGLVIDNEALAAKLEKGELSGAVLDVYPEEPLPRSSPLWRTPNLIMSPHCAVDDAASYAARALDIFLGNLERYLAGRKLANIVDTRLGY
ncbi:MAG: D-2-hydroxyacid dehydrogenase [Alphaproteobacteria bacterium]|nr:D-2-hydroxyacid dehydrogenase [Alphaproteobacteria bacterium]